MANHDLSETRARYLFFRLLGGDQKSATEMFSLIRDALLFDEPLPESASYYLIKALGELVDGEEKDANAALRLKARHGGNVYRTYQRDSEIAERVWELHSYEGFKLEREGAFQVAADEFNLNASTVPRFIRWPRSKTGSSSESIPGRSTTTSPILLSMGDCRRRRRSWQTRRSCCA